MTPAPPEAGPDRPAPRPRAVHPALLVAAFASLVVLAALVVVAFARGGGGDDGGPPPGDQRLVGQALPDLPFERFDGTTGSLAEVPTPAVINFFAYWCTPCKQEMPDLERIHQRLADQVEVFGLSYAEAADQGARMVDETGVTYDVARDPTGTVLEGLGGTAMPTTVVVDGSGTVVAVHSGIIDEAGIEDLLDRHGVADRAGP